MLRRATKRQKQGQKTKISDKKSKHDELAEQKEVLGDKDYKLKADEALEKYVLGGGEEISEELERGLTIKKQTKKDIAAAPKPAWHDEDDDQLEVQLTERNTHHHYFKHTEKKEISGEKYAQTLKNQFEKVAGNPDWAKLKWEKSDDEQGSDDEEADSLIQSTGNYLASSSHLPRGILQIKRCTDANQQNPAKGKLRAVEFHPSAQVMLAAGMNHTLNLFQIDGEHNPKIHSVFINKFPIYDAHFSADGQQVILGSNHKHFYYFDMIAGKIVFVPWIKGLGETQLKHFVVSPDGKYLAFLGRFGDIHLLSAQSKEWMASVKMNGSVEAVAFTKEGSRMLSIGDDGEVYVWDMSTRDCVHTFKDEGCYKGTALAISPDTQYIATGSHSGVVNVYDKSCLLRSNPSPLKAVSNLTSPCSHMTFNSTSEILAIASNQMERALKMVHFPSMTVFSNFPDRTEPMRIPYCMDFSLNSGYFSVGDHSGKALLYRVKHYNEY